MKRISLILTLIVTLSFGENPVYGKIWTAKQLTNDKISVFPQFDNGKVAWAGRHPDIGKRAIFCQDIATGNTQIITGDTYYPNLKVFAFRDGMICWRIREDDQDIIYLWKDQDQSVQIIDQYEPGPFPSTGFPPSYNSLEPRIDNGQITYPKWDGNDYEIFLWDANTITQLTDNTIDDYEPQIACGKVCFTSEVDGGIKVRLWDNGKITDAPQHSHDQEDSYAYRNIIAYCEYHPSPELADIVYWDGNKACRIKYPGPDYEPSIADGSLVWTNYDWDHEKKIKYHSKPLYFDGYKIFNILETDDEVKEPYSEGYYTVVEKKSVDDGYSICLLTYLKSFFHQNDTAGLAVDLIIEDTIGYLLCTKKILILDMSDLGNITVKSSINAPDSSTSFLDMAKTDDCLFLAARDKGVVIIVDIKDVNNPAILKFIDTPGQTSHLTLTANYLYVGDRKAGLQIIDVANPAKGSLVAHQDFPGETCGSCMINEHILYTSNYDSGITISSLTADPSHPSFISNKSFSHPIWNMKKFKNNVFCVCPGYGIITLDITDPLNPIETGQCELPDGSALDGLKAPLNLGVQYPFLFVAHGEQGILVLNMNDVKNPKIIERINTTGFCCDVFLHKYTLFAANGQDGMAVFDISDYRPKEIQDSDISFSVSPNVTFPGNNVSLSASVAKEGYFEFEFQVSTQKDQWKTIRPYSTEPNYSWAPTSFDIGNYEARVLVRNVGEEIEYRAVVTSDEKCISRQMVMNNLATACPGIPKLSIRYMAIRGNYLYASSGWHGILIFNISDPNQPKYIKYCRLSSGTNAMEIAIKGGYLFFANREYGVEVMDISDPQNPLWVANYDTPDMATRLAIKDNLLFIGDRIDSETRTGVICLDISDPAHPTFRSSYAAGDNGACWGVTPYKDYLFVAHDAYGIEVLDITHPSEMILAASISDFSPSRTFTNKVEIDNNTAFSVEGNSGIHSFDISNLSNIKPLGSASLPVGSTGMQNTPPLGAAIKDHKYAFVANGSDGVRVFNISNPSDIFEVGHYDTPNFASNCLIKGDCLYVADYDSIQVLDISSFCHGTPSEVQITITPGLNQFSLPGWIDSCWSWNAYSLIEYLNSQGIESKKILDYLPLQERWQAGVWENGNFQAHKSTSLGIEQ